VERFGGQVRKVWIVGCTPACTPTQKFSGKLIQPEIYKTELLFTKNNKYMNQAERQETIKFETEVINPRLGIVKTHIFKVVEGHWVEAGYYGSYPDGS
jgi:hypothetical protein